MILTNTDARISILARILLLAFVCILSEVIAPQPAICARGDLVATVMFSQPCASGLGVGIAFDGTDLWYSCYDSTPDLLRADPTTGVVVASYNIAGGLGALAYDTTRNAIWAGWGGSNTGKVYLVQLDKEGNVQSSSVKFDASDAVVCGIDDGLAYDAQDDSLYVSDDCSSVIHHYSSAGVPLAEFPWAGNACYNSGLAIGGNLLYEGSDGCNHVWVADKSTPATSAYDFGTTVPGDPNFRDEDLECDIFTFASQGKHVMWSKEAYPPMRAHAFEIDFGSCGVGGLPALSSAAGLARTVVGAAYKLGAKGWDWSKQAFVSSASIISGYKYSWMPSSKVLPGLDCSGLVFWAYNKAFGATKYQSQPNPVWYEGADAQFHYNSQAVSEGNLRPGDLLFFDFGTWSNTQNKYVGPPDGFIDHVAMYVGGNDVVSASSPTVGIILAKETTLRALPGFAGFGRVTTPVRYFTVRANSPVSLVVSDPDGFTIDANTHQDTAFEHLREIPGELYYSERQMGADGIVDDTVSSPKLKNGAYLIGVVPKAGASPTDTYGLDVETPNGTISLAQNVPISKIPPDGYGILVNGATDLPFTPVTIAIKPGSSPPGSINLRSKGKTPLAVLSNATFDATSVDPRSITFAGASVALEPGNRPMASFEDVDGDGMLDLVVHVDTQALELTASGTQAVLVGRTYSGELIRGVGAVNIKP